VTFFPEGGHLVDGHLSKVAFEIKNNSGKAIAANCSLLADGKVVASFSSDLYGRGTFQLTPITGKTYTLKVDREDTLPLQVFPAIE
jgi:hypothetical protein